MFMKCKQYLTNTIQPNCCASASLEKKGILWEQERASRLRSEQIDKELKRLGKLAKSTIKLLLLGTGESGKSTILKQMRIINMAKISDDERRSHRIHIKLNISEAIGSILQHISGHSLLVGHLEERRKFVLDNLALLGQRDESSSPRETKSEPEKLTKLWDAIDELWSCEEVKRCARHGNLFNLVNSAEYFLDRLSVIRHVDYVPCDQDILRCRTVTLGITETNITTKNGQFSIFDIGGQRGQRRKWIQCFDQVTAIIFVVDIASFNMLLREDPRVNRLRDALESFRQIWSNRYLYHISIILFLNKYDLLVKKIVNDGFKLEDYFPEFAAFTHKMPDKIDKQLHVSNEDVRVTMAKLFIREQFMNITNEDVLGSNDPIFSKYKAMMLANRSNSLVQPVFMSIHSHSPCDFNSPHEGCAHRGGSLKFQCSFGSQLEKAARQGYFNMDVEEVGSKFCLPYFTTAIDTEHMKRVFSACDKILKKEHLLLSGLL